MNYGDFSNPKGSYGSQQPGTVNSYQTSTVTPTPEDPKKEIVKRMKDFASLFYAAKPYLPDHPAVKVIDDFINRKQPRHLIVSDQDVITEDTAVYLQDLRRMKEVQTALLKLKKDPASLTKGMSEPFVRPLGDQSIFEELKYPFNFVGDLYTNTTRAMLGSFNGTATVTEVGTTSVVIKCWIYNPLTWESLTRFPAHMGGYEGKNSYVPHIPGWEMDMNFDWREIIPRKKN